MDSKSKARWRTPLSLVLVFFLIFANTPRMEAQSDTTDQESSPQITLPTEPEIILNGSLDLRRFMARATLPVLSEQEATSSWQVYGTRGPAQMALAPPQAQGGSGKATGALLMILGGAAVGTGAYLWTTARKDIKTAGQTGNVAELFSEKNDTKAAAGYGLVTVGAILAVVGIVKLLKD